MGDRLARLGATKASKSLSCKPLSARVRHQPGSVCLDMFLKGWAVTWPVTVVSQDMRLFIGHVSWLSSTSTALATAASSEKGFG